MNVLWGVDIAPALEGYNVDGFGIRVCKNCELWGYTYNQDAAQKDYVLERRLVKVISKDVLDSISSVVSKLVLCAPKGQVDTGQAKVKFDTCRFYYDGNFYKYDSADFSKIDRSFVEAFVEIDKLIGFKKFLKVGDD